MKNIARRKRKRKTNNNVKKVIFGVIVFIAVFIAVILNIPSFNVVEVYCEGSVNVDNEEIIAASKIECGKNIFLENVGLAKREIKKNAMIEDVSIKRVFPNKIHISVTERVPVAYVYDENVCVTIDSTGIVIRIENGKNAESIKTLSEQKTLGADAVDKLNVEKAVTENNKDENGNQNDESENDENESSEEYEYEEYTDEDGDTIIRRKENADLAKANTNEDKSNEDESDESNQLTENKSEEKNAETTDIQNTENEIQASGEESPSAEKALLQIPSVKGIKIISAKDGNVIKTENDGNIKALLSICNGLREGELLSKVTSVNLENMSDIKIIYDKRLEILIGSDNNLEYRMKFLSEVIKTKISETESVIMDYTGDDIYVRQYEDGASRVAKGFDEEKDNSEEDEPDEDENTDSDESADGEDIKLDDESDENSDIEN